MRKKYIILCVIALFVVASGFYKVMNDTRVKNVGVVDVELASAKSEQVLSRGSEINIDNNPHQDDVYFIYGDKGDSIRNLQVCLYNIGYDIVVDGEFGNGTLEAIKSFQNKNGMAETGYVDSATMSGLQSSKVVRDYEKNVVVQDNSSVKDTTESENNGVQIPVKTSTEGTNHALVILADSYGTCKAKYTAYEKVNGVWTVYSSGNAVIGVNGFSDNRKEGDGTTPIGRFGVPFMFGTASNPGVKFEYRRALEGDYWSSNNVLSEYNIWTHYSGSNPDERFSDYEALWKIPLYKYAAVIDYNYYSDKQLGKGSAIFLHITSSSGGGTAGCVAVSEGELLKLLKWMDPAKKPCIIMGVQGKI